MPRDEGWRPARTKRQGSSGVLQPSCGLAREVVAQGQEDEPTEVLGIVRRRVSSHAQGAQLPPWGVRRGDCGSEHQMAEGVGRVER